MHKNRAKPGGREWSGFVSDISAGGVGLILLGLPKGAGFAGRQATGTIVGAGIATRFHARLVWQKQEGNGTAPRTTLGLQFSEPPDAAAVLVRWLLQPRERG